MKKFKKWISLGLCILCLGIFTGCSLFTSSDKEPTKVEKEIVEIESTVSETYKKISTGCVGIYATSGDSGSVGSGVVYKEESGLYYVVTNNHVIEGMKNVRVYRGGSKYYKATVIGTDPKNDIAVITFSLDLFGGAEVYVQDIFHYDEEIISVGQSVMAIGCPLGLENFNTLTTGVVSRVTKREIQTNAEINPGNSGGGLFNFAGRLIGINTTKEVYTQSNEGGVMIDIPVEGLGYAISLSVVKKCITDIENKKTVLTRPLLGISILPVNRYLLSKEAEEYVSFFPNTIEEGIIVTAVHDGAAKKAGLLVHDIILMANSSEIITANDLSNTLNLSLAGDLFVLDVYRPSEQKTISINVILE